MPLYEYKSKSSGNVVLQHYESESDAPSEIQKRGETFQRHEFVPSGRTPEAVTVGEIPTYEFQSYQLEHGDPRAPYHTKDGTPAFRSKHEVEEFCRRTQEEAVPGSPQKAWLNEGTRHGLPQAIKKARRPSKR